MSPRAERPAEQGKEDQGGKITKHAVVARRIQIFECAYANITEHLLQFHAPNPIEICESLRFREAKKRGKSSETMIAKIMLRRVVGVI